MALVVILLCMGLKYGLKLYTHHGESIAIPDIRNKQLNDAERILDNLGLQVVVTDTGVCENVTAENRTCTDARSRRTREVGAHCLSDDQRLSFAYHCAP